MTGMVKDFIEALNAFNNKTAPYDVKGEVRRIEGKIAWVRLNGGIDETPVEMTINCVPGEIVRVRVSGGYAWITGNETSPPTDDRLASRAYSRVINTDAAVGMLAEATDKTLEYIKALPTNQSVEEAIEEATSLITGAQGGYVTFGFDEDGKPKEIFIADNEDPALAENVWRWNVNGFAHSSTGIGGPYTTAITIDGKIVADFILAGTMSANLVRGGIFLIGGSNNGNGILYIQDSSGNNVMTANNTGIKADYSNSHLRINRSGTRTIDYHSVSGLYNGKEANAVALEGENLQFYHKHGTTDFDYETLNKSGWIHTNQDYQYGGYFMSFAAGNDSIFYISSTGSWKIQLINNVEITGNMKATGSKSRVAETEDYSKRLLYCYETPTPMFGDIGEGLIGDDGQTYIFMDPIFAETIDRNQYQIFLQKYGNGDAYVSERAGSHFVVSGTPGLPFGWEIKAKQRGYSERRLDMNGLEFCIDINDYGESAASHIQHIAEERSA